MFTKEPIKIIDGDYYFGADNEGQKFSTYMLENWTKGGFIKTLWEKKRKGIFEDMSIFCNDITATIANENKPFMEIACGPGMGIAPLILVKNPSIPCLITDSSSHVIQGCRYFIDRYLKNNNISLASFDGKNIPIKKNSFDYVTSNLGICAISNHKIKNALECGTRTVQEIYRILKPNGCLVTIEYCNIGELHWETMFISAGFKIEHKKIHNEKVLYIARK